MICSPCGLSMAESHTLCSRHRRFLEMIKIEMLVKNALKFREPENYDFHHKIDQAHYFTKKKIALEIEKGHLNSEDLYDESVYVVTLLIYVKFLIGPYIKNSYVANVTKYDLKLINSWEAHLLRKYDYKLFDALEGSFEG